MDFFFFPQTGTFRQVQSAFSLTFPFHAMWYSFRPSPPFSSSCIFFSLSSNLKDALCDALFVTLSQSPLHLLHTRWCNGPDWTELIVRKGLQASWTQRRIKEWDRKALGTGIYVYHPHGPRGWLIPAITPATTKEKTSQANHKKLMRQKKGAFNNIQIKISFNWGHCGTNIKWQRGKTIFKMSKINERSFPGGLVIKNPPSNAGDANLIPG